MKTALSSGPRSLHHDAHEKRPGEYAVPDDRARRAELQPPLHRGVGPVQRDHRRFRRQRGTAGEPPRPQRPVPQAGSLPPHHHGRRNRYTYRPTAPSWRSPTSTATTSTSAGTSASSSRTTSSSTSTTPSTPAAASAFRSMAPTPTPPTRAPRRRRATTPRVTSASTMSICCK